MTMLLLGFGYQMAFLKTYGLGAVGFTMMLSVLSMELNVMVELSVRYLNGNAGSEDTTWPMPVSMITLINAEFAAATLLITFGVIIGWTSPLQLLIICISQSFFYALNKLALGGPKDLESTEACLPNRVSDVLSLIGTAILWVYWPSFVGATETGDLGNEYHCVINTILALIGSTTATVFLSQKIRQGKYDPVHVVNSTLAGGVAIGVSSRLNIGPEWAITTGFLAGVVSVCGYAYVSPFLQSKCRINDTCGVGNLHGYPSVLGALLSVGFIALDSKAAFLQHGMVSQMLRQLGGIVATLGVSTASGYATGFIASKFQDTNPSFVDSVWWQLQY